MYSSSSVYDGKKWLLLGMLLMVGGLLQSIMIANMMSTWIGNIKRRIPLLQR
jgi:hypothetical protein